MKTGHWIDSNSFLMVVMGDTVMNLPAKECSICHKPHIRGYGADFCPNCGAKMQEQEYEQELEQEPKPDWIPVSERLPEEYCLFCDIDGDVFYGHIYDDRWWAEGQDDRIKNVIAWMPLPEPYRPEGGQA